ncbi:hypothetical protein M3Y99_01679300 [Aphelenchoides fujianensis]|nr:hypothetical protein M3Y99_01679300 [Aphelenchoides fujianensis]
MQPFVFVLWLSAVGVLAQPYSANAPIYEQAMRLLEREVQLMREFISDVGQSDDRADGWPVWRGISNVFTDLSGMFGQGNRYYERYESFPPPVNHTEMARRARIRLEETKREIMDLNKRISELITENFKRKPYGDDFHRSRPRDEEERPEGGRSREEPVHDDGGRTEADVQTTTNASAQADETKFPVPDGFVGFELPIRGSISRELLLQQMYEEEYEQVDKMSARQVGELIRPMIARGTLNANVGQCRIANLLDESKMVKIEP